MRILVISNLFPPQVLGGYEILCGQVCGSLRDKGYELEVLTSDHGAVPGEASQPWVHRDLRLYLPFGEPAAIARRERLRVGRGNQARTRERVAAFQPDLIFIWSLLRLSIGPARAAQEAGVPALYTFNDETITGYLPARFRWRPRSLAAWASTGSSFRRSHCEESIWGSRPASAMI